MSNSLREQRWSHAGGDARSTEIPDYDVTTGTHMVVVVVVVVVHFILFIYIIVEGVGPVSVQFIYRISSKKLSKLVD